MKDKLKKYESILKKNKTVYNCVKELNINRADISAVAGAYVFCPAAAAFSLWLINEALKRNIKRLYFLSRDGYFFYRCVSSVCEKHGINIECRYLSCSRFSLKAPLFFLNKKDALDFLVNGENDLTAEKILIKSGFTENEINQFFKDNYCPFSGTEKVLKKDEDKLKNFLLKNNFYNELLIKHSKEKLTDAIGYLKQEGLFDSISFGIADSGWTGRVQASLKKNLEIGGCKNNFHGFYWGLYTLPKNSLKEFYHGFYFKNNKDVLRKTFFNNNVFEAVFSAPHGMTAEYLKTGKIYLPVYLKEEESKRKFILKNQKIFDEFFEEFSKRSFDELMNIDLNSLKKTVKKLFKAFMITPSKEESTEFGSVPFSHGTDGEEKSPLALYFSKKDFKNISLLKRAFAKTGLIKINFKESPWLQGSAVLYSRNTKKIIFKYTLSEFARHFKNSYIKNGKG